MTYFLNLNLWKKYRKNLKRIKRQKYKIKGCIKNSETISSLAKSFNIHESKIKYLIVLIKKYGYNILRNGKNKYYSNEYFKKLRALVQEREIV